MDENLENAGIDYFSTLYGATSDQGEPQQTFFDKWRDRSIAKAYRKHTKIELAQSDVLDVGCGYGWLLDAFQGARTLSGVDIAHHAVEQATKRKPERFFKQGNLQEPIPFNHTFDLILVINVIEHLTQPEAGTTSTVRKILSNQVAMPLGAVTITAFISQVEPHLSTHPTIDFVSPSWNTARMCQRLIYSQLRQVGSHG